MSTYTVRYAHLDNVPNYKVGDPIKPGDIIGVMGNTGQSIGAHLHIDCVYDIQTMFYNQANIEKGTPQPAPRQLNHFIDYKLFGVAPVITTYYADPIYMSIYNKVHFGYDVVPDGRHKSKDNFNIYWNRSMDGKVVQILENHYAMGNCIYIAFDARE